MNDFDIDIDCKTSFKPEEFFPNVVKASIVNNNKITPHPCGVYFQDVPIDTVSGLAAVPYNQASPFGCFKMDFLHLTVYDHFSSKDEIDELIKHEPDWKLLEIPSIVAKLFQISKHYDLVNKIKPKSIMELADCLAIIRPQKRFLLDNYINDRENTRKKLYEQTSSDSYGFKKGHSISYALVIVLQLHLVKANII